MDHVVAIILIHNEMDDHFSDIYSALNTLAQAVKYMQNRLDGITQTQSGLLLNPGWVRVRLPVTMDNIYFFTSLPGKDRGPKTQT